MKTFFNFVRTIWNTSNDQSCLKQIHFLPPELFEKIFSDLNPSEIKNLGLTCKDWKACTDSYLKPLERQVAQFCRNLETAFLNYPGTGDIKCVFTCKKYGKEIIFQRDPKFLNSDFRIAVMQSIVIYRPKTYGFAHKKVSLFDVCSLEFGKHLNQVQIDRIQTIYRFLNHYIKNSKCARPETYRYVFTKNHLI